MHLNLANVRSSEVESSGQTLVEYTYDALNRRVTQQIGSTIKTFVYDGESVVEEYTNGLLDHNFIYADYIDDPILTEYSGQNYYFVKDNQFSIKAITDANGGLVESYEYNPFGLMTVLDSQGVDITGSGSTINNPFGYTGRRWDAESSLWYYRNRMYTATLGRFMQRDPTGYVDGLNLYAYVLNNPLRYTDPDGLIAKAAYDATVNSIYAANNLINEALIFPALDILSLPDIGLDLLFNNTAEERIAAAASLPTPFEIDNIGLGIVAGLGKIPKVAKAIIAPKSTAIQKYYPGNNGFLGTTERKFLMKGDKIDRFGGSDYSRFFSPQGTPAAARSLPAGSAQQPVRSFEVLKPFVKLKLGLLHLHLDNLVWVHSSEHQSR